MENRDFPARYGSWQSIYIRFHRWALDGTFTRIPQALQAEADARGGPTSKIHLACDGAGRPLAFLVTGGNVNDCTRLQQVLQAIRVPRLSRGRPRTRPDHVVADLTRSL
ncbi:hypothetical protein Misp03_59140 [Microbispora sp. NBRC 16548]|nr:hypothetical protein Misp03_59140 [Microbispora sp. NBRC 16548]